ncbi:archaea-specific SMC-related protein [Haloplanus litoreus]|uniref:Archaea-specific SMC-related protein n=1 Tax=Haloplanus litoreus TaxID=767515 RepID=A0ABD5ZY98_9EURY
MGSIEQTTPIKLTAENIGGIKRTSVQFDPGVTLLVGRNATHRTSFLQAIMAALGSEQSSLKGDADEGSVRLELGDNVYTRTLTRQNGNVHFGGEPFLDDPELADLFAFLLESNEARRTVALEGDLREIIMGPVDTAAIQANIKSKKAEQRDVEKQIEELQNLKSKLPSLEKKRTRLESDIEDTQLDLDEKRDILDSKATEAAEAREQRSALDDKMEELRQKESELDRAEFQLETQQKSLETLEEERESLEAKQAEFGGDDHVDLETIESDLRSLRNRKQALNSEISKLQNVIQFNEEMLEGASEDIAVALRDESRSTESDVTDQLLDSEETVVCWTCGTEVKREAIEDTLDQLRELRQSKYSEQNGIKSRIDELKSRRDSIQSNREERERVEERLGEVRAEIDERKTRIEDLESEREELTSEVDALNAEIEELERENQSEVLEVHREVNRLEVQLERLETERTNVEEEIEDIESRVDRIDELEERKSEIQRELADLRTRVEQVEQQAVDEFNDHMDTVLNILEYANIDRIWVERTEREVREGRRKVTKSEFTLHVIRSSDDGVTYEDEFSHLSESEREVTGLVFALAGYLVHDVYEKVPFMLLDSLEAIDSDRIAKLVDYFHEYADYLVVALLPEDARAPSGDYNYVKQIN